MKSLTDEGNLLNCHKHNNLGKLWQRQKKWRDRFSDWFLKFWNFNGLWWYNFISKWWPVLINLIDWHFSYWNCKRKWWMNSDAGFLWLATKLGIPSFIQLGILSADFGLGEFSKGRSMHWEFPVTSVRSHNFGSERHYPECPGGHSLIKVTRGGSNTDVFT